MGTSESKIEKQGDMVTELLQAEKDHSESKFSFSFHLLQHLPGSEVLASQ